jgi:dolichyl-phosphate beta-glucosyltransferase
METILVSIIIPAYNEEFRLPVTLQAIAADPYLKSIKFEIVLVVEPSKDRTLAVANAWALKLPRLHVLENQKQKGKGYAVKCGMLEATGDYVFFMDADLSVPISTISEFIAVFISDPQLMVVFGSRRHTKSNIKVSQNILRRKMGGCFNLAVRTIARLPWADTQCGFKAFRRQAIGPIFNAQILHGFAFDVEILVIADKLNLKLSEQPVVWTNSPQSHVRIFKDSLMMLYDIYKVTKHHRQTKALK